MKRLRSLEEHGGRVLEELLPDVREAHHGGAVDDTVVRRPRDVQDVLLLDRTRLGVVARLLGNLAQGADGHLGRHDDGRHVRATDAADVRQREGAVLQVVTRERTAGTPLLQGVEVLGDLEDRLRLHVLHVRHDQALGRVHGNADVVGTLVRQVLDGAVQLRVHNRVRLEGERGRLDEERHVAELRALGLGKGLEGSPDGHQVVHVDLLTRAEGRDLEGLGHGLNHDARDSTDLLRAVLRSPHRRGRGGARRRGRRRRLGGRNRAVHEVDDVLLRHTSTLARGRHLRQVDRVLRSDAADRRGGQHLGAGRALHEGARRGRGGGGVGGRGGGGGRRGVGGGRGGG
eukprot:Rhum_TRINITY_DN14648_c11_g1::Rhum_TRINITY_DN14648_c11_g1_i1::g.107604::m.107604